MKTKNKDIIYGNIDILGPDEFAPHNVKVRITTMIDMNVLEGLKDHAKKRGLKYQTLINNILREFVDDKTQISTLPKKLEAQVRKIVRDELKKRSELN